MSAVPLRSVNAGFGAAIASAVTGLAVTAAFGLRWNPAQFAWATLMFALPVALAHAVIIGGPLYAMARSRWPLRWWSAALGGFVSGTAPIAIIGLIVTVAGTASGRSDPVAWLMGIGWFGASGAIGGLAFRAIRGGDSTAGEAI